MTPFEFIGAVNRYVASCHRVPTPKQLAAWMRETHPNDCQPWATRLAVIPDDAQRYPLLPEEHDCLRISRKQYDPAWWTPGARSGLFALPNDHA